MRALRGGVGEGGGGGGDQPIDLAGGKGRGGAAAGVGHGDIRGDIGNQVARTMVFQAFLFLEIRCVYAVPSKRGQISWAGARLLG
jgi:hypothetical protein